LVTEGESGEGDAEALRGALNRAVQKLLGDRPLSRVRKAVLTAVSKPLHAPARRDALEARRDKTRALKQGMMRELLTGRTRLV
jgi:hypothetical protein